MRQSLRRIALVAGLVPVLVATSSRADDGVAPSDDAALIAEVRARDEALAAAHARGDMATYTAGLSKQYAYIDLGGKRVDANRLATRRENDRRRVVSSTESEDEAVVVAPGVVLLRGVTRTESTYYGGLPRAGASRWSALWAREADGVLRLVAETATPIRETEALPFTEVPQPRATLEACVGDWLLATTPPLQLGVRPGDGALVAQLAGETVSWTFRPASATHLFATDRPFELRCDDGGRAITFVTWGIATKATRRAAR